jgi:hypothetical protein
MDKEILRRNIMNAIKQPCIATPWDVNCKDVKPNGLSEDGKYVMVNTRTDDTSSQINLEWNGEKLDIVEEILGRLPAKYRDHLVTIQHDTWISYSYDPVFDTDTQAMWDKEMHDFYTAKQEWCDKYGCD